MNRKMTSSASNWRGKAPRAGAGEWARAAMIVALIAAAACLAAFLLPAREADAALPVAVSRVMSSNPSACLSVDGRYYDWFELQNISDGRVSLAGWRATDSGDLRGAYAFGDIALEPGERLVVYCGERPEGYAGSAPFTGFKLSSDGGVLLLADARQRFDVFRFPALGKGEIYQRDPETGTYAAMPYYEALGLEADYAETLNPDFDPDGLMISEVMPVNRATLPDEDGEYSDWIELYNASTRAVSLENCALSDDVKHAKWFFPARTIQPGEYMIVFASGKDRAEPAGELHTSFSLSKKGETVRLYDADGEVISWLEYEAAEAETSLSRQADGTVTSRLTPSPGHENTAYGARLAAAVARTNGANLYINEIYTTGSSPDWVEIRNAGTQAVELAGMGLSDNPSKPRKWQFPAGATLAAGGCALVELTGTAEDGTAAAPSMNAPYAADFALSTNETVCLSTPEGELIDAVRLVDQHSGISYGRADGYDTFRYFKNATPGAPNAAQSYDKVEPEIQFSPGPGIIRESAVTVTMTSDPGMTIYYTTDGTDPTPSSAQYTAPITLSSNTCVKAVAWASGTLASEPIVASYIFGQHNHRLVCVTGKRSELNGSTGTLNTGAKKEGYDAYVEMYEADGTKLVGQGCHLTLAGHNSRTQYKQKSFRLNARREYGDTRFRAALFSNRDYTEYKAVVLRASGQDCMQTHMRDSILTSLAADTSLMYQETEVCEVYVNGEYWGLYNMRERIDQHSIAQFEGWDNPDDVAIVENSGSRAHATHGSVGHYKQMLSWVRSHDMSKDENIELLRQAMDIENYLDYVAMEIYTANLDLSNVRCYRSTSEDGRWKWAVFDLDLSYQVDRNSIRDWMSDSAGTITPQDTTLFRGLMDNAAVRDYFLTRMGQLLATTFSSENVVGKIQARYELIKDEMPMNCKRWGWSTDTWKRHIKKMVDYANARPKKLIGYFQLTLKMSDAEVQHYFGDALAKAGA